MTRSNATQTFTSRHFWSGTFHIASPQELRGSMSIRIAAWYVRAGEQLQEPPLFLDYFNSKHFLSPCSDQVPESKAPELSADTKNPE